MTTRHSETLPARFSRIKSTQLIENELYKAILFDKLGINEGMVMENVTAQMLRRNGHKLYFYSRNDAEDRRNHMEIDFLITEKKKIAPVEVKSSGYTAHFSLNKFKEKFPTKIETAYILYSKDVMVKEGIVQLPNLYGDVPLAPALQRPGRGLSGEPVLTNNRKVIPS